MPRRTPIDQPEILKVTPLKAVDPIEQRRGRPRKLPEPTRPDFNFAEDEKKWFDYFINSYQRDYPDLTDTDKILLEMAGVEYIKVLRMFKREIETGELITMARQNPAVNFRALLDMLSTTRKGRLAKGKPEDETNEAASRLLKAFGN